MTTLTEAEDNFVVACGHSIVLLSLNVIVVAHAYSNLQTTEDMLHVKHCFAKEWFEPMCRCSPDQWERSGRPSVDLLDSFCSLDAMHI